MALLNPPQILPVVIRAIVEVVRLGNVSYTSETLPSAMAPADVGGEDEKVVKDSLSAARTLRLVDADTDGRLQIGPALEGHLGTSAALDDDVWRRALRRSVLEHETSSVIFLDRDEAEGERTAGTRDLLGALTWFLAQDAEGPLLRWESDPTEVDVQTLQAEQFGTSRDQWPVYNDTRLNPLYRWVDALGLGTMWPEGLGSPRTGGPRPIPVVAVRDVLADLGAGTYEIEAILSRLTSDLPVLWGGSYRVTLTELVDADPDPDVRAGGIDSSVGLALLVLERQGRIRLEHLPDVDRRIIAAATSKPRPVSHVEVEA